MDINKENILDKHPFLMQPRKAVEASHEGKCGYCGKTIQGKKYSGRVFIRTIWGPPSMSLESSGYWVNVNICESCRREELETEKRQAEYSYKRLKEELEEMDNS